jgi:Glyoxalase-like domain
MTVRMQTAPRLEAIAFDAVDPVRLADFWAHLLGRRTVNDARGVLVAGTDAQVGLRFVAGRGPTRPSRRLHLHLASTSTDHQQQTVAQALELGGTRLDVGQLPDEGHVVLADPEGNELCVIEPDNSFLTGCGFLGEVACDGTHTVGKFWAAALDWPLVWDQGQETAIQSRSGGTKIAWGGPPVAAKHGTNRQRFHLNAAPGTFNAEADRLQRLGATALRRIDPDTLELADPDGNEFVLTESRHEARSHRSNRSRDRAIEPGSPPPR